MFITLKSGENWLENLRIISAPGFIKYQRMLSFLYLIILVYVCTRRIKVVVVVVVVIVVVVVVVVVVVAWLRSCPSQRLMLKT